MPLHEQHKRKKPKNLALLLVLLGLIALLFGITIVRFKP